jgi:8-oxo-dGTP diphosphatase
MSSTLFQRVFGRFVHTNTQYLFEHESQIPNFKLKTSVVTCFIQHQDTVLVLKRSQKENHPTIWCTPGGEIEPKQDNDPQAALIRELFEETGLSIQPTLLHFVGKRYSRVPGWDYILYLYYLNLHIQPAIQLSEEHSDAKWVPLDQFKSLRLLTTQEEAFDLVFSHDKKPAYKNGL